LPSSFSCKISPEKLQYGKSPPHGKHYFGKSSSQKILSKSLLNSPVINRKNYNMENLLPTENTILENHHHRRYSRKVCLTLQ